MNRTTIVQVAGLLALFGLAVATAYDGIRPEVTFILVLGVLAISAPTVAEEIITHYWGDE